MPVTTDTHAAVAERYGLRLLTAGHPEWPTDQLSALSDAERPTELWVAGALALPDVLPHSVTITGTRQATEYGRYVAGELAQDFARSGWVVATGAGYGVEESAHRSALALRRPTIAVLAHGLEAAYPTGLARMIDDILATGLLVSAYAPGTVPSRQTFTARARLLATLTRASVLVETPHATSELWRGVREVARSLYAVPGPVTSLQSRGPNELIADGFRPALSGAQIIAELTA